MRRFLTLAFLFASALAFARAQSVHWEGADDSSEVQLVFEDCAPDGDPKLPPIEDSVLHLTGTSSQTTISNGAFSRSTILTYSSRARRAGVTLQIPEFTVQTNKGPQKVAAFTGGAPRVIPDSTVNARLMTGSTQLWAGEVFPIVYILDASRRNFNQLASNLEWNPAPLVVEDWSKPEPSEMTLNGEARINIIYRTRAYAKTPGTITLNPANQLVRIATGVTGFGLFQQQRVDELTVSTKRPELIVRPLPPPTVPGFSGAVGQFQLVSKVVPSTAAVGEPVTWTLELSGSGNWPDIAGLPQREVSKDFQVVSPAAKRTPVEGKLFDATLSEDIVLVPTKPGTYTLGPIEFTYFDPKTGSYQTLSTPRSTIHITAAAPANASVSLPNITTAPPAENAAPAPGPAAPALPAAIPRDPLPDTGRVLTPRPMPELLLLMAVPFVLFLLFWGWLAVLRARQTDPERGRRAARKRLAGILARLGQTPAPDLAQQRELLLQWQADTAVIAGIQHAAPPPPTLPVPAWSTLWAEADRALYAPDPSLPSDWVVRAQAALASLRLPGFSPLTAFLPRNLTPFLTVFVVALLLPSLTGEDAAAAYRRADFPAAEKGWQDAVAADPVNPSARYNLSLALAQQDRWDLAMAQASAAFVQAPGREPIRWQFNLAAEKAGYLPNALAAFSHAGPLQSRAWMASPAEWQAGMVIAAVLVALALSLFLLNAYRSHSRWRTWCAVAFLLVGVALTGVALVGYLAYGEAADARAVIVWRSSTLRSIPTDADTTQKTSSLPAGSIAVVDKTFINDTWLRLNFENGQTGWVRKADVVGLWR